MVGGDELTNIPPNISGNFNDVKNVISNIFDTSLAIFLFTTVSSSTSVVELLEKHSILIGSQYIVAMDREIFICLEFSGKNKGESERFNINLRFT